jgi:type I restriction enzyme S subunit
MEYLPLTKCLEKIIDNRGKTVPTCETGIPLIATNCIKMENIYPVFDKVRYISQDTYDNWFRAHLKPNDIIFVNKGTPGKVALCPDPLNFVIAQDAIGLRANNDVVYWKYLYYYLKSPKVQSVIANNNVGLIIPHFKKEFLNRIEIPILPMEEQIKIGDILHGIDLQVQRNQDMCHKLRLNDTTISCFSMKGEMRYAS